MGRLNRSTVIRKVSIVQAIQLNQGEPFQLRCYGFGQEVVLPLRKVAWGVAQATRAIQSVSYICIAPEHRLVRASPVRSTYLFDTALDFMHARFGDRGLYRG
jgi:hypothetical protein